MDLKRETQGAFCVSNAKSQMPKSMKINMICTVWQKMDINKCGHTMILEIPQNQLAVYNIYQSYNYL